MVDCVIDMIHEDESHDHDFAIDTMDQQLEYEEEYQKFVENMNLLYYKRIEPKMENPFAHYKEHYAQLMEKDQQEIKEPKKNCCLKK